MDSTKLQLCDDQGSSIVTEVITSCKGKSSCQVVSRFKGKDVQRISVLYTNVIELLWGGGMLVVAKW
ncbi:hypothetical protein EJB05_53781, partial [Eragrostis curvula]